MHTSVQRSGGNAEVRNRLRGIANKVEKHNVTTENGGNEIATYLRELEDLQPHINSTREHAVDSQAFVGITGLGLEQVKRLARGSKAYTAADLLRRLKTNYVRDEDPQTAGKEVPLSFNWVLMGSKAAYLFRSAPKTFHMLGPMDSQPKAKRQIQRQRRREPVGEAVRPEEVEDLADHDTQETDRNMEEMWKALNGQPQATARLIELVLNTRCFAQTCENAFSLSFLVRDARVELHHSEDGLLVTSRKESKRGAGGERGELERTQFVLRVTMAEWENWCKVTDSDKCLMQHRKSYQGNALLQEDDSNQEEAQRKKKRVGKA